MFEFADDSMCLACNQNRLTFEPPSLYCTCCGQRIKRNQVRVTGASGDSVARTASHFRKTGDRPMRPQSGSGQRCSAD